MAILTLQLLLVYLIITFIFKPSLSTLNCGIWAWSSNDIKNWNPLSKFKFELLGVEMDSRGGDGCGIAYDHTVLKSAVVPKFDEFWRNKDNIPNSLISPCIMGHDRKASVGEKTYRNTQPILFGSSTKHPLESVLCHNGTIYNHRELAKKYKVTFSYTEAELAEMSDSQILTLLIDQLGWSILNEYIGSAALIYMNAREGGVMYVYHGKSPYREAATVPSEERPMHYVVDNEDIWFCSTKEALGKIHADKSEIKELPHNKVFKVVGNTIEEVFEVDRSKCYQFEGVATNYHQAKTYDYYGEGWNDRPYDEYGNLRGKSKKWKDWNKNNKDLSLSSLQVESKSDIFLNFDKGFIKLKDKLVHGPVSVYISGRVVEEGCGVASSHASGKTLYFYDGNLLKGRKEWIEAYKREVENPLEPMQDIYKSICKTSFALPYVIPKDYGGDDDVLIDPDTDKPFNGTFKPLFSTKELLFNDGKLKAVQHSFNGFPCDVINDNCDPDPSKYFEWFEEYTKEREQKNSEEATDESVNMKCPFCFGTGMHYDISKGNFDPKKKCEKCNGTAYILPDELDKFIDNMQSVRDRLDSNAESAQAVMIMEKFADEAIQVLEEPELAKYNENTLGKIRTIQKILNSTRYGSDHV